jgi:hypothetical protein
MADTIIKATSPGSLKIQQESGVDALTVDASGNVQLAGELNAGTLGSAVAVDNCIIKKWHHFTFNTHTGGNNGAGTNQFTWTSSFVPLDPVNNSFWVVGIVTGHCASNDACGYGLRFSKSGGSSYDFDGKGVMYFDAVGGSQSFQNYFFHIAAGTLAAGTYTIYHRCYGSDSQMSSYASNNSSPRARLTPQVQAELMIREFKNP